MLANKWHQAHYLSTLPHKYKWSGGVGVQTFKQGMKKQGDGSVETKLARFLLSYRITPQSTTGESPAQLRWRRNLRSHIDPLQPDVATRVHLVQSRQRKQHD